MLLSSHLRASDRRSAMRLGVRLLGVASTGIALAAFGLRAARAQTYTYDNTTDNFSTGFTPTLTTGSTTASLVFGGATYTATDDLASAVTVNALQFTNTGAVTLARSAGANNQIVFDGTTPTVSLGNTGSLTIALDGLLNALTTFTGSGSLTISGVISGTGGLTQSGTGTLTLTGANTYTGGTTVNSGILLYAGQSNVGTGLVTVNSGGTAASSAPISQSFLSTLTPSSAGVVALGIASSGSLDFSAATGANLTNASLGAIGTYNYSGTLTPNGTVYRLGGGGGALSISSALTGAGNSVVIDNNGTPAGGTVILTGANTYTAGTTIDNGAVLRISADGTGASEPLGLAPSGQASGAGTGNPNITFNGGTLSFGAGVTIPARRGLLINTTGTLDLRGFAVALTGQITGAGQLIVSSNPGSTGGNNGVLTFGTNSGSFPNTFTGGVQINSNATVKLNTGDSTLGNTSVGALTFNGGTLQYSTGATSLTGTRPISITSLGGTLDTNSKVISYSGIVSGAGGLTVTNSTAGGTLTLSGTNTYAGGTTITPTGSLIAGNAAAFGNGPLIVNGALNLNGKAIGTNALSGAATGTITNGGTTAITLTDTQTTATTYAGVITDGATKTTAFTMNGTGGTLTLSGANTYSGNTTLTAGTLNVNNATALGAGTFAITGTTATIDNTSGAAITLTNNNPITLGGNLTFNGSNPLNVGTGAVSITASRTITLAGGLGTGPALTFGGILTATANGNDILTTGPGVLNLTGGTLATPSSLAGISVRGSSTLNFSGVATTADLYTRVGDNGSSGTLNVTGGSLTSNSTNSFYVGNATPTQTSIGVVNLTGGTITIGTVGEAVYIGDGFANTTVGTGTLNISTGGTFTTGVTTGNFYLGNTKGGNGTVELDTGGTLATLRTIALSTTNTSATGSGGSGTVNFNGGTLLATGANPTLVTGLTTANVRNSGAIIDTGTFAVGIPQALTHSAIGGDNAIDGGLTKNGVGTLTLTGANTYTGATTINAGTLVAGGMAIGTGAAVIASGATLSVGEAPNATASTISTSSLSASTLAVTTGSATPLLTFNLGANGTSDVLNLTNTTLTDSFTASAAGVFDIGFASATGAGSLSPGTYTLLTLTTPEPIADAPAIANYTATGVGNVATVGGDFSYATNGGNVIALLFNISGATMPEPSSVALALLGATGIAERLAVRRRRRIRA